MTHMCSTLTGNSIWLLRTGSKEIIYRNEWFLDFLYLYEDNQHVCLWIPIFSYKTDLGALWHTHGNVTACAVCAEIQNGCQETGSTSYQLNRMRYRRNSNGYTHIFDYTRLTGDTADIVRRRPMPEIKMAALKPEVLCISGIKWDIREIPTATPTFSMTPDSLLTLSTLSDVGRHAKSQHGRPKREIVI